MDGVNKVLKLKFSGEKKKKKNQTRTSVLLWVS